MSHSSIIHVSQTNTKAKMAVHDNLLQLKDAVLHENAPLQNIFRKLIAVGRGSSVVPFFSRTCLESSAVPLPRKPYTSFTVGIAHRSAPKNPLSSGTFRFRQSMTHLRTCDENTFVPISTFWMKIEIMRRQK